MYFVADLKEIRDFEYGDIEESILYDMIINGIKDEHGTTKL